MSPVDSRFSFSRPVLAAVWLLSATASAQYSLHPITKLPTASAPDATAAGDLDGDGDLDLATTARVPDRVVVRRNQGDGSFAAPESFATGAGTGPHGIAVGDVDQDGDLDLFVALEEADQVLVLVNAGDGTFTPGASTAVGAGPRDLVVGDLDHDGDLDLVVLARGIGALTVLVDAGGGSFATSTVFVGLDVRGLALGDLTGDGFADIAASVWDAREVRLYANDGAAHFAPLADLSLGTTLRPVALAIADLDGDGDQDVAATTAGSGIEFVSVFKQNGGSFGSASSAPTGAVGSVFLAAVDLDQDGDLDIATANRGSDNLSVLPNSGNGFFNSGQLWSAGASGPAHVLASDLDGNGSADLVTTNVDGRSLTVFWNGVGGAAIPYCVGAPNSAGAGAHIGYAGSLGVAANDFTLSVTNAVPGQVGVFFYGPHETQVALGDGLRCVGGPIFRLQPATQIDAAGSASRPIDFNALPAGGQVGAGSTWNFQFWYRDPTGPGGTGTNTSNALHAVFAP